MFIYFENKTRQVLSVLPKIILMNWNWKIFTQTNNYQKATFPPSGKPPKPDKPTENFGNDSNKKSQ